MLFINKFMFITPNLHIYASEIPKFPPFSWVNPDLLLAPSFPHHRLSALKRPQLRATQRKLPLGRSVKVLKILQAVT